MRSSQIIFALCIAYFVALTSIYYCVNAYVDKKAVQLREETLVALNSFFSKKPMYVDLLYGPYRCSYEEKDIPQPEEPSFLDVANAQKFYKEFQKRDVIFNEANSTIQMNLKKKWEEEYGDFIRMYELDIYPDESQRSNKSGWALKVIRKKPDWANFIGDGIETYLIYP